MTDAIRNVLNTMSGSYLNRWKLDRDQELAWYDGLRGFTPEVLRRATIESRVDFPEWPPTLMEFRRYCIAKRDENKEHDTDEVLIDKYNAWVAEKAKDGYRIKSHIAGESAEEYRCRLVWEFEKRKRGLSGAELSEIVKENREANRRNREMLKGALV